MFLSSVDTILSEILDTQSGSVHKREETLSEIQGMEMCSPAGPKRTLLVI